MRCPVCNAEYREDERFCPRDGTRLIAEGAPARSTNDARLAELRALAGQMLGERYRVRRKIGEGGMSHVFLADDARSGEQVAVKLLAPQLVVDAAAMERLRLEAEMGSRLAHPNVCHILGLGETASGIVYIVMPFIAGESLYDRTSRLGQLPLDAAVRITGEIAAGLGVAHALGIVHRDLKPENVMLTSDADGVERAVVMDFGLAKQRRVGPQVRKLTRTGIVLGTPEFMSPEQLRSKPLDARSDVYALGLMTFEMLTGRLPFVGKTQQEIMIARLRSDPAPLAQIRGDLRFPAGVDHVLSKCLSREPSGRYGSAEEFAAAFARAADGETRGSWIGRTLRRER